MAAKKKSTRKKAAKKKASSKPKKSANRKAAKKKASKKTKKVSRSRKSPKANTISVKKVARKKKSVRRAKPIGITVPKGPGIAPMEAPEVEIQSMNINALFLLGLGQITATLIRSGQEIGFEPLNQSGSIQFPDVRSRDVIAISGSCSGTAEITADRPTVPATPRKFKEQQILDLLKVK